LKVLEGVIGVMVVHSIKSGKGIRKEEGRVFDIELPHIEGEGWWSENQLSLSKH